VNDIKGGMNPMIEVSATANQTNQYHKYHSEVADF